MLPHRIKNLWIPRHSNGLFWLNLQSFIKTLEASIPSNFRTKVPWDYDTVNFDLPKSTKTINLHQRCCKDIGRKGSSIFGDEETHWVGLTAIWVHLSHCATGKIAHWCKDGSLISRLNSKNNCKSTRVNSGGFHDFRADCHWRATSAKSETGKIIVCF